MRLDLSAPDYTTLSRRRQHLTRRLRPVPPGEGLPLVLDSTGLSIVGAGEWAAAKHGGRGRRGWRKLHRGVDQSGVILVHLILVLGGDARNVARRVKRSRGGRRRTTSDLTRCDGAAFVIGDAIVDRSEYKTTQQMGEWAVDAGLERERELPKIVFGLYNVMIDEKILVLRKPAHRRRHA